MPPITLVDRDATLHQPRLHAAVRTRDYIYAQLIPYIGNKRKLLHLIRAAVRHTGSAPQQSTFVDLFTGSTVVARWAKRQGFRVLANDWEPYAGEIARGTVELNRPPAFAALGGHERVFRLLNTLPPRCDYITEHLCPADDAQPDPLRERLFFTRANGQRIDAIRARVHEWENTGLITAPERAFLLAALIYAVSYASNTSGVFKGYHHGWGGKTSTALYRILAPLTLTAPVLFDNQRDNRATQDDAQSIAGGLREVLGGRPDIVYLDPPYNQHPYGSNYHVLNTVTLWDKPPINRAVMVDGKARNKAAIRTDWRTQRRSMFNHQRDAPAAFAALLEAVDARWLMVSYSTDGNIPLAAMLTALADRGRVHVFARRYKRYRVSTPRMSAKSHNVEFVAVVDTQHSPNRSDVPALIDAIEAQETVPSLDDESRGNLKPPCVVPQSG